MHSANSDDLGAAADPIPASTSGSTSGAGNTTHMGAYTDDVGIEMLTKDVVGQMKSPMHMFAQLHAEQLQYPY
eukprot:g17416.t1